MSSTSGPSNSACVQTGSRHQQVRSPGDRGPSALCVTLCDVVDGGGLDWIPVDGCHLTHDEIVEILGSLRALVDGTDPDEPNRAHAVSIAYVVAEAIEREGEGS
jgi:hypothetical protein